jgi:hypothetical protein
MMTLVANDGRIVCTLCALSNNIAATGLVVTVIDSDNQYPLSGQAGDKHA